MILGLWKLLSLFIGELVQKAKRGIVAKAAQHMGERWLWSRGCGSKTISVIASKVGGDKKIFRFARDVMEPVQSWLVNKSHGEPRGENTSLGRMG